VLFRSGIGGFVLISQAFFRGLDQLTKPAARIALESLMLLCVVTLGWRTEQHLPVWSNDFTLWQATLPTCRMAAYCHVGIGTALIDAGYVDLGIPEIVQGVQIRPSSRNLEILGDAYTFAGRHRDALSVYRALAKSGGGSTTEINVIYSKLAKAAYYAGTLQEATDAIERGKLVNPEDPGLWVAEAFVAWKQGNLEQAHRSLDKAFAIAEPTMRSPSLLTGLLWDPREAGEMLADLRAYEVRKAQRN